MFLANLKKPAAKSVVEEKQMVFGENPLKPPGSRHSEPFIFTPKWSAILALVFRGVMCWIFAMFMPFVSHAGKPSNELLLSFAYVVIWTSLFISFLPIVIMASKKYDWSKAYSVSKLIVYVACFGSISGCSLISAAH